MKNWKGNYHVNYNFTSKSVGIPRNYSNDHFEGSDSGINMLFILNREKFKNPGIDKSLPYQFAAFPNYHPKFNIDSPAPPIFNVAVATEDEFEYLDNVHILVPRRSRGYEKKLIGMLEGRQQIIVGREETSNIGSFDDFYGLAKALKDRYESLASAKEVAA